MLHNRARSRRDRRTAVSPSGGFCAGDSNLVGVRAQLDTPLPQSLPQSSGVTGSRPTLALVAAAPNSQESSPMPSKRPISWGSERKQHHRTVVEAVEMVG